MWRNLRSTGRKRATNYLSGTILILTNDSSAKQWQPRTPAMAAGLTDHVWTLREVLLFRVPPWPRLVGL